MKWSTFSHQPWDDYGPTEYHKEFDSWKFNQDFMFYKTPNHYLRNFNFGGILRIPSLSDIKLDRINTLLNTEILKIKNHTFPELSWSETNSYLKYFDKTSYVRFFIKKEHLSVLEENPDVTMTCESLIDKNGYLEVYLISAISSNTREKLIEEESFFKGNQLC